MKKQYTKKRIMESVSDKQQLLAKIQQYNGVNIDHICTIASDKIKIPDSFAQSPNGYSEQYWIALPNSTELYVDDFGDFKQYYADVGEDSRFPFVMIGVSNDETRYKFMYIDPRNSQVEMGRPKLTPRRTVSEKKDISKKYTKRQIIEAIAYWEKQLKMLNESKHPRRLSEIIKNLKSQTDYYGDKPIKKIKIPFNEFGKIVDLAYSLPKTQTIYDIIEVLKDELNDAGDYEVGIIDLPNIYKGETVIA